MAFLVPDVIIYAIVPVKRLGVSKRRLSKFLSPLERKFLTIAMLEDVLRALKSSTVHEIVVVSSDPNVRMIADKFGVSFFSPSHNGLNPAVEEATAWCMQNHADSVLVVPADIPLLSSADVNKIVELGNCNGSTVVLSPSHDGGTNALFQSSPNLIRMCFGPHSFAKHIKEAHSKGVCVKLQYSTSLATDIDSAEDLGKLLKTESNTACRRVLDQFKLVSRMGAAVSQSKSP
jgi:2-phospho-L-lactate guanylyltransferase